MIFKSLHIQTIPCFKNTELNATTLGMQEINPSRFLDKDLAPITEIQLFLTMDDTSGGFLPGFTFPSFLPSGFWFFFLFWGGFLFPVTNIQQDIGSLNCILFFTVLITAAQDSGSSVNTCVINKKNDKGLLVIRAKLLLMIFQ